jgi:hypothetical protein
MPQDLHVLYARLFGLLEDLGHLRDAPTDRDGRPHEPSLLRARELRSRCVAALDDCVTLLADHRAALPLDWLSGGVDKARYVRLKRDLEDMSAHLGDSRLPFQRFKMPLAGESRPELVSWWDEAEERTRAATRDLRDWLDLSVDVGEASKVPLAANDVKPDLAALPSMGAVEADQWAAEHLRDHPYTNLRDLEDAVKADGRRCSHETLRNCDSVRKAMEKAGTLKVPRLKIVPLTEGVAGGTANQSAYGGDPAVEVAKDELRDAMKHLDPDTLQQLEKMPEGKRDETLGLLVKQRQEEREDERPRSPREGRRLRA